MKTNLFTTGSYFRKITYDDNNVMVEWEDNYGKGEHYKLIDNKWTPIKSYKPHIVIPRRRKHNTWDK
jgi:hypothetical protein